MTFGRVVCFIFAAACGTSSNDDPPAAAPDGGAGPVVQGNPNDIELKAPKALRVIQGRQNTLDVTFSRLGGAEVALTVDGLPPGVTVKPVNAPGSVSNATLVFEADDSSKQGTTATVTVSASNGGNPATASVDIRVTGAPGTFDKSFGDGGRVKSYNPFTAEKNLGQSRGVVMEPDGRFTIVYEMNTPGYDHTGVARILPDGTADPSFHGGALLELKADRHCIPYGILRQDDGKYVIYGWVQTTGNPAGGVHQAMIARVNADGSPDGTFGDGTPFTGAKLYAFDTESPTPTDEARAGGLVTVDGKQEIFIAGATSKHGFLAQVDASGAVSPKYNGGAYTKYPASTNAGSAFFNATVSVRNNDRMVGFFSRNTGSSDPTLLTYFFYRVGDQGPIASQNPASPWTTADYTASATTAFLADGSVLTVGSNETTTYWKHLSLTSTVLGAGQSMPSNGSDVVSGILATPDNGALVGITDNPSHGATVVHVDAAGLLDPKWGGDGHPTFQLWDDIQDLLLQPEPVRSVMALTNDDRAIIVAGRFLGRIWN